MMASWLSFPVTSFVIFKTNAYENKNLVLSAQPDKLSMTASIFLDEQGQKSS